VRVRRGWVAAAAAAVIAAVPAPAAHALPDCPAPRVNQLLHGQGQLESVVVSADGRLFFSDLEGDRLLRLDAPGREPVVLTPLVDPGGLVFDDDGSLIAGAGNSAANGLVGDVAGRATLERVDPDTGAVTPYATGLSMANGVARAPDGSIYASNDFGSNIDRVVGGRTDHGWAKVLSGNGLAVDRAGRHLYVAQTFQPPAIQRVSLDDPSQVTQYAAAGPGLDWRAGLDGLAIDAAGALFVAANGAGEIWKVDRRRRICVVLRGLPPFPDGPSAVAVGSGGPRSRFPRANLYVVTFSGDVLELPGVAAR
jgi:gluconolactonase